MFSKIEYVKKCQKYYSKLKNECKHCKDKPTDKQGIVINEKTGLFRNCDCTKKYLSQKKYIESGIPIKYLDKFDEIVGNMSDSTSTDFDRIVNNIKLIIGNCNLLLNKLKDTTQGSSSVSMLFAKMFIDKCYDVFVVNSTDLVQMFFEREMNLKKLQDYDVLIIDNLGYEYNKKMNSDDYISKSLLSFLQHRSTNNKFTIISSSHTKKVMQKKYNSDIMNFIEANYISFLVDMKRTYKSANEKMASIIPELKDMLKSSEPKVKKPRKETRNIDDVAKPDTDKKIDNDW